MLRRRPLSNQPAGCSSGSRPSDDAKSTHQQHSTMNINRQESTGCQNVANIMLAEKDTMGKQFNELLSFATLVEARSAPSTPTKGAAENPAVTIRRRTVPTNIPAQMQPSIHVPQAKLEKGLLVTDVNASQAAFLRRRAMATTTFKTQLRATDAAANPANQITLLTTDVEMNSASKSCTEEKLLSKGAADNPAKTQLKRKLVSQHNFTSTRATKQKQVAETSTKPKQLSRQFIQGSLEWEKHRMFRVAFNMCNPDGSWKLHPALQSTQAGPRELDVLNILYLTLENQGPHTSNLFLLIDWLVCPSY